MGDGLWLQYPGLSLPGFLFLAPTHAPQAALHLLPVIATRMGCSGPHALLAPCPLTPTLSPAAPRQSVLIRLTFSVTVPSLAPSSPICPSHSPRRLLLEGGASRQLSTSGHTGSRLPTAGQGFEGHPAPGHPDACRTGAISCAGPLARRSVEGRGLLATGICPAGISRFQLVAQPWQEDRHCVPPSACETSTEFPAPVLLQAPGGVNQGRGEKKISVSPVRRKPPLSP